MEEIMEQESNLSQIDERMKKKILKVEMSTINHAMKKFASMGKFTVDYYEDFFMSGFGDGPKKYLHLYFTFPRGTKKKPDITMRFINDYVLNDILTILKTVFPKYTSVFSCVRIEDHSDVWQFDVFHK